MTSVIDCVVSYIASAFSFCSLVYIIPSFLHVQDFVRRPFDGATVFPVGDGGTTVAHCKCLGECGGVIEPDLRGDERYGNVGKKQALFCVVEAGGLHITSKRHSGFGFEDPAQVKF